MRRLIPLILILVVLGIIASLALAQSGALEIPWYSVAGGSGRSEQGDFALAGTTGQAQEGQMDGGEFSVSGGFWRGYAATVKDGANSIYMPFISN